MTELRSGITTGTCAAAAAKAATLRLFRGDSPESVDTPLPDGNRIRVPIARIEPSGKGWRATVIKDAGDDPDVTDGHEIQATVRLIHEEKAFSVTLSGGKGVGTATLPGLPVPVGEAAINPAPREQIKTAAMEAANGQKNGTLAIVIEVPEGERLAEATMNPRLGIVDGISILGTHGIVKPYSHDSWKASIEEALDVARAVGVTEPVFTTGRRSEKFHAAHYPGTTEQAMVQAADFFAFAMQAAAERGFRQAIWAVFPGKLVKQAQGNEYTHAKTHPVDFDELAECCRDAGLGAHIAEEVRQANTARQVFDQLKKESGFAILLGMLRDRAQAHAERFSGHRIAVRYRVYDFDGTRYL
ncbi:cobalt-precorrin-5B (C(1))-methyltransferase CbiD [Salidesulfovibrio brasiliensis]|uniref:cobalt-precorrin-5B (C(1))-methyltransferase CbiD n=1 Tax=Salidesulfovibrio brasiliensis TaxID=221711 RepID=UPI0006D16C9A|nr:cobalt-precorrin-5B (C(1))-methyltransferase CbiD [Salidesulfovibrio brasiliensis]